MNTENDNQRTEANTEENTDPKRHFDSCSNAFQAGREDAATKAREAAPMLKNAVADTIYDVAYGVTYGAFFAGALAKEFIPKTVKDVVAQGVEKGAAAGRAAADKVRQPSPFASETGEVAESDPLELPAPA